MRKQRRLVPSTREGCCPVRRRRACRSCSARWPGAHCRSRRLGHPCHAFVVRWSCRSPRSSELELRPSGPGTHARTTVDPMSISAARKTKRLEAEVHCRDSDSTTSAVANHSHPTRSRWRQTSRWAWSASTALSPYRRRRPSCGRAECASRSALNPPPRSAWNTQGRSFGRRVFANAIMCEESTDTLTVRGF